MGCGLGHYDVTGHLLWLFKWRCHCVLRARLILNLIQNLWGPVYNFYDPSVRAAPAVRFNNGAAKKSSVRQCPIASVIQNEICLNF